MSGREQLIRDWWDRLAQSEAEMESASLHRRWIKRIYVRLFRFLLAVYGRGDWTAGETPESAGDGETSADDSPQTHMELIDLRTDTGGAPPKSVAQIRHTLKTVHNAVSEKQIGPHAHGLDPEDWIVVASRRDGVILPRFGEVLYLAGVPWRCRRLGRDTVMEVRLFHEEEALDLLSELGSSVRNSRRERRIPTPRESRRVVRAITSAFLGAIIPVFGFVIYRDFHPNAPADQLVLVILIGMLVGGVCGEFVGSEIERRRR